MKARVLSLLLAGAVMTGLLTGCGGAENVEASGETGNGYQKIELVMAVNGTDIQIDSRVADKFAELVEEASNGNVTIAVYPNDQLAGGNSTKGIEMIAGGGVDLAAYATCVMAVIDEQLSVATIPWIFDDYKHAREIIDGSGGEYYAERLEAKGITYLGSFHNGFRQITNSKREVRTPEDVKRLKIRVPGSEVYMKFFKTLGADPVAMSWSEVFTAIQQGTIDGQENGICITESAKMDEIQDYLTLWNYTYENDLFVANTEIWESLEQETRELLQEKAKEACEWGRDTVEEEEAAIVEEFKSEGMTVTELNAEELDAFKEEIRGVKQEFIDKYGEKACKAFRIESEE
ncbi:DctP family TRAP transporter solute-binding subunit [Blautia marasmi]|uniref:DctP family TRAP transporter solute-binding subunit n=1 Tax=Blautia marasmi TaxID=1917868 RepID=UPI000CF1E72B|nr:DctP family TRAP transporter solute-binding subunit [Blautia marasmi]